MMQISDSTHEEERNVVQEPAKKKGLPNKKERFSVCYHCIVSK